MVPKIIFTYWEGKQLSELHYYTLYTICKNNPSIKIIIYTSLVESDIIINWNTGEHEIKFKKCVNLNDIIQSINQNFEQINIISIDFEKDYKINNSLSCVHKADIIRIIKLYEHGGIWFDMDMLFIKPIPNFFFDDKYELYLFTYSDTIPTGFIASTPKNKLMTLLYNGVLDICKNHSFTSYQIVGPNCWNFYFKYFCINDDNIKFLSNDYVYPYDWLTIKDFFYSNNDSNIKEITFGIHWYNGWSGTKNFINNLDKNNLRVDKSVCEKILYNLTHVKLNRINIDSNRYQTTKPYPYMKQDNFLDNKFALDLQNEIMNIPQDQWDRYDNLFEQKYTLRDKFNFPTLLKQLFDKLTEDTFIKELSAIVGYNLQLDTTRNFWGVHSYKKGDKLDIHVDAGYHPSLGLKKQVTLGIYLSYKWEKEYGSQLEIWKGDNCSIKDTKIYKKVDSIEPLFNRLIIFTCNDYAWHGTPIESCGSEESRRIFITISYLSDNNDDLNKRVNTFFVARPEDPINIEKDNLQLLCADPEKYKEKYMNNKNKIALIIKDENIKVNDKVKNNMDIYIVTKTSDISIDIINYFIKNISNFTNYEYIIILNVYNLNSEDIVIKFIENYETLKEKELILFTNFYNDKVSYYTEYIKYQNYNYELLEQLNKYEIKCNYYDSNFIFLKMNEKNINFLSQIISKYNQDGNSLDLIMSNIITINKINVENFGIINNQIINKINKIKDINTKIFSIDCILWINLERSKDRKENMEKILGEINIPNIRIDAIDGQKINFNNVEIPSYQRDMSKGYIGCTLSHIKAINRLKNLDGQYFMICEDDISFENIFMNIENLEEIIKKSPKFDILMINKTWYRLDIPDTKYFEWKKFVRTVDYISGTTSYIISREGINKIINFANYDELTEKFTISKIFDVADIFIYKYVNTYAYRYNFINTVNQNSTLGNNCDLHKLSTNIQTQILLNDILK